MRRQPTSGPSPGNSGPSEKKRQGPGPKSGPGPSKKFAKIEAPAPGSIAAPLVAPAPLLVAPAPLLVAPHDPVADLDRDAVLRSVTQGAGRLSNKNLLLVADLIESLNQRSG